MTRGRPITRPTKPRAVKPDPLPAHAPPRQPTPAEMALAVLHAWADLPPVWESGGHE